MKELSNLLVTAWESQYFLRALQGVRISRYRSHAGTVSPYTDLVEDQGPGKLDFAELL